MGVAQRSSRVTVSVVAGCLWVVSTALGQDQPKMLVAPPPGGQPAPMVLPPSQVAPAAAPPPAAADSAAMLSLMDAVRSTLQKHPAIAAARTQLFARNAEHELAAAPFDVVVSSSLGHRMDREPLLPFERIAPEERELKTDTTEWRVGAAKTFDIGTTVLPSVSLARVHSRRSPETAALMGAQEPVQRARVELSVTQPLLRNAGRRGAASVLAASAHGIRAAEHGVRFTAQQQVFDTMVAYWTLVATEHERTLFQTSVERSAKLVEETRALVDADQRPRGDLRQFEGNLVNRQRSLLEAEGSRMQALHRLQLVMGLPASAAASWRPSDNFPAATPPTADGAQLTDTAIKGRPDLLAAREAVAASEALYKGADHNTLPALDLNVAIGYSGALDDDGVGPFFEAAGSNVPGVSGGASLTLELPVGNRAQGALRDLAHAQQMADEIARDDLARTVRTQVLAALDALRYSAATVEAARKAEAYYELALQDERDKLRAGLSTVIDVVLTEERLTQAQLSRVQSELSYAVALAQLSRDSGALPASEADLQTNSAGAPNGGR